MNYSVFQYEVNANPNKAFKMARVALSQARAEIGNVNEAEVSFDVFESQDIMNMLDDNLRAWESRRGGWRHSMISQATQ